MMRSKLAADLLGVARFFVGLDDLAVAV